MSRDCNIISIFNVKIPQNNKRDINIIKNINIIKKLVSYKNNDQLKDDHFIT